MSKKFPVHAAIELQDVGGLEQLLENECDASFHLERRLPDSQVRQRDFRGNVRELLLLLKVSPLHQACCTRPVPSTTTSTILEVCLEAGADTNMVDNIGQTPLFYAVTHCQSGQLLPLLLQRGED